MSGWQEQTSTAVLVLSDGTVIEGIGLGKEGAVEAEVCFNTAITGYQEILTDPSYAGQIVTFTFPHIGNVGINPEDMETVDETTRSGVRGCVLKANITDPSNFRSTDHLDKWLADRDIIGLSGIDTRALTALVRENGLQNAVIAHNKDGKFNLDDLKKRAANWPGLEGMDLAKSVTANASHEWNEKSWDLDDGYTKNSDTSYHVVALDFGIKRNIMRLLADLDCKVTVLPATASSQEIFNLEPDGVFLSNGPGDPAATGQYALETIKAVVQSGLPTFGICLGHQMLGLALGAKTTKMHQGHHGANHPVKDFTTGKVEIVSMNHGFAVDRDTLPDGVKETHQSLFDGSNCGLELEGKPVFSVQHHPEASPGPQDSHYLFRRFVNLMRAQRQEELLQEHGTV